MVSIGRASGRTLAELIAQAERLEAARCWRRASQQWLKVFDRTFGAKEREMIRRRRNLCLMQAQGRSRDPVRL